MGKELSELPRTGTGGRLAQFKGGQRLALNETGSEWFEAAVFVPKILPPQHVLSSTLHNCFPQFSNTNTFTLSS